jgi:hypothetical protein
MIQPHIGDDAALYALGALDDDERAAIDAHVRSCAACAQLLGAAERDVTLAASMEAQRAQPPLLARRIARSLSPRSAWPFVGALAAALVVGLLPTAYFWERDRVLQATSSAETAAIDRLASVPHRMASFNGMNGNAQARVMYGADGSWYVVIAQGVRTALAVAWMHDGERTMLGMLERHGDIAMLYLPRSHRMDQLALMDGARIVAQAQLTY